MLADFGSQDIQSLFNGQWDKADGTLGSQLTAVAGYFVVDGNGGYQNIYTNNNLQNNNLQNSYISWELGLSIDTAATFAYAVGGLSANNLQIQNSSVLTLTNAGNHGYNGLYSVISTPGSTVIIQPLHALDRTNFPTQFIGGTLLIDQAPGNISADVTFGGTIGSQGVQTEMMIQGASTSVTLSPGIANCDVHFVTDGTLLILCLEISPLLTLVKDLQMSRVKVI